MGLLDGRVVIVSGAGRGLGRCHALQLAAEGATVVVNDLGVSLRGEHEDNHESPADAVVAEITAAGGTAVANGASVSDWPDMEALVAATVERFGDLHAVVNNAGFLRDRMVTSMTEEDFDSVIAVHLKGTFTLTKHACDYWRAQSKAGKPVSGRIVNTTSGSGLFANIGQANYGSAKSAIATLTQIVALEMQRIGVTANAISPIAATRMLATIGATVGATVGPLQGGGRGEMGSARPGQRVPCRRLAVQRRSRLAVRCHSARRRQPRAAGGQLGGRRHVRLRQR